jgi:hypothetical protein
MAPKWYDIGYQYRKARHRLSELRVLVLGWVGIKVYDDPVAVVDTNVLEDLYSWHDLFDHYNPEDGKSPDIGDPKSVWRRARVREALLLACHFHNTRATTVSISEGERQLLEVADESGKAKDGSDQRHKAAYITIFLWLVQEHVLNGWTQGARRSNARGNDADEELMALAKEHSLPLITSEGYTPTGPVAKKMRLTGTQQGIQVLTAAEYLAVFAKDMDQNAEAEAFLERFKAHVPAYLVKHNTSNVRRFVADMEDYYRHCLLGITPGRTDRVLVAVQPKKQTVRNK